MSSRLKYGVLVGSLYVGLFWLSIICNLAIFLKVGPREYLVGLANDALIACVWTSFVIVLISAGILVLWVTADDRREWSWWFRSL